MKTEHTPTPENTGKLIDRYFLSWGRDRCGDCEAEMLPDNDDGDWVKYEDHINSYSKLKAENERLLQMAEELQNKYAEANGKAIRLQAENEQLEKDKEKWFEVAKKRTYENEVLMETLRKDTEQIGRLQADNEQKEKRIKDLEKLLYDVHHYVPNYYKYQIKGLLTPKQ